MQKWRAVLAYCYGRRNRHFSDQSLQLVLAGLEKSNLRGRFKGGAHRVIGANFSVLIGRDPGPAGGIDFGFCDWRRRWRHPRHPAAGRHSLQGWKCWHGCTTPIVQALSELFFGNRIGVPAMGDKCSKADKGARGRFVGPHANRIAVGNSISPRSPVFRAALRRISHVWQSPGRRGCS